MAPSIWFAGFFCVLIWAHFWGDQNYSLWLFIWYVFGIIPSAIIAILLGFDVWPDDNGCWEEVDPRGGRYIQYCEP